MELTTFAEILLTGNRLEDKLRSPGVLTDHTPRWTGTVPDAPARPANLTLRVQEARETPRFPGAAQLHDPAARAAALHAFANHELLALELFAVALLRFPDAPAKFRMGLAATIIEEQKHLGLYLERLRAHGLTFGDQPVNSFFWDSLHKVDTPLAFIAAMALTLEQANLDFAAYYGAAFAAAGDSDSAAVLATVYEEEIGHVGRGLAWFRKWRAPELSDWEAYKLAVPAPLTPRRARGIGFDVDGRRRAGLDPGFIEELRVFESSRGRPPRVYWFNPWCEDILAEPGLVPGRPVQAVVRDLAGAAALLARTCDVALVDRRPGADFLGGLTAAGFEVPEFVTPQDRIPTLTGRLAEEFVPWGATPDATRLAASLHINWQNPPQPTPPELFSKVWAAGLRQDLAAEGVPADIGRSRPEVDRALERALTGGRAVVKCPLGASGRKMVIIDHKGPDERQSAWMDRMLDAQGCLLIEPWLARLADLSVQVENGRVLGLTRFLTDDQGHYLGHVLGLRFDDLATEDRKAVFSAKVPEKLTEAGLRAARMLVAAGYRGPAGVDAFVYRPAGCGPGQIGFQPVSEINPRLTMGRIALRLASRIAPGKRALWLHLFKRHAVRAGYGSVGALAAALTAAFPLGLTRGLITEGVLPTNDPEQAESLLTMIMVGSAADAGLRLIRCDAPGPDGA